MRLIYHITIRKAWDNSLERGAYHAESLNTVGFIHCSTREQLVGVANAFYRDVPDLVILAIDEDLADNVRYEAPAEDGYASPEDRFPHVYGLISVEAVVQVVGFPAGKDGQYELPGDLI